MKRTTAVLTIFAAALFLFTLQTAMHIVRAEGSDAITILVVGKDDTDEMLRKREKMLLEHLFDEYKNSNVPPEQAPVSAFHFNYPDQQQYCADVLKIDESELPFVGIARLEKDEMIARFPNVSDPAPVARQVFDTLLKLLGLPLDGELIADTNPDHASVVFGGKEHGTTPLELKGVRRGMVSITLRKDGYLEEVRKVRIVAGKKVKVEASLKPGPIGVAVIYDKSETAGLLAGRAAKLYERYMEANSIMFDKKTIPLFMLQTGDPTDRSLAEKLGITIRDLPAFAVVSRTGNTPEKCLWKMRMASDPSGEVREALQFATGFLKLPLKIPSTKIDIVPEPADSSVVIDRGAALAGPVIDYEIAPGTHEIEVKREDFLPEHRTVKLEFGDYMRVTDITLKAMPLGLVIVCTGAGVDKTCPWRLEKFYEKFIQVNTGALDPQSFPLIRLDLAVYADRRIAEKLGIAERPGTALAVVTRVENIPQRSLWSRCEIVDPARAMEEAMKFTGERMKIFIKAPVTMVDIVANPPDAEVWVDGRGPMKNPVLDYRIESGTHTVEIIRDRYVPIRQKFQVEYGDHQRMAFSLEEASGTLTVTVKTDDGQAADDAQVAAGEKTITGSGEISLPSGSYELTVKKKGYREHRERLVLKGGEKKTIAVTLKKKRVPVSWVPEAMEKEKPYRIVVTREEMSDLVSQELKKFPLLKGAEDERPEFIVFLRLEAGRKYVAVKAVIVDSQGRTVQEINEVEELPQIGKLIEVGDVAKEKLHDLITRITGIAAEYIKSTAQK